MDTVLVNGRTGEFDIHGYLGHKKHPLRRALQYPYAWETMVFLGGWVLLITE